MLPVPDLEPKKRRGGKRYRKMKEKYGLTDVQKAANRIQFNKAEEEFLDGEEVVGLGMVGKEGTGKLRKLQVSYPNNLLGHFSIAMTGSSLSLACRHSMCPFPPPACSKYPDRASVSN